MVKFIINLKFIDNLTVIYLSNYLSNNHPTIYVITIKLSNCLLTISVDPAPITELMFHTVKLHHLLQVPAVNQ